jgi:succinate-acetate transporter protein
VAVKEKFIAKKREDQMTQKETIANPGALGLGAFALTTFLLSLVNVGFIGSSGIGVVLGMAFFYGGLAQILAGMWEFKTGNIFGATCFTSFGAFWMGLALILVFESAGIASVSPVGLAACVLAWGGVTLYATVASFHTNVGLRVLFVALTITFFLLAVGEYLSIFKTIGGAMGILVAFIAWYLSMAILINGVAKRDILPL